jgi:hypothetical protein
VSDAIFGALPALAYTGLALYCLVVMMQFGVRSSALLGFLVLTLLGLASSLTLLYTIAVRGRVMHRDAARVLLGLGLLPAGAVTLFLMFTIMYAPLALLSVSVGVSAVKQIVALSNERSEVHP